VVSQPNFTSIRSLALNARELNFALWPGRTNMLEVSSNLVNWSVLREYSPSNGLCRFTETNSAAQRFYRIKNAMTTEAKPQLLRIFDKTNDSNRVQRQGCQAWARWILETATT